MKNQPVGKNELTSDFRNLAGDPKHLPFVKDLVFVIKKMLLKKRFTGDFGQN